MLNGCEDASMHDYDLLSFGDLPDAEEFVTLTENNLDDLLELPDSEQTFSDFRLEPLKFRSDSDAMEPKPFRAKCKTSPFSLFSSSCSSSCSSSSSCFSGYNNGCSGGRGGLLRPISPCPSPAATFAPCRMEVKSEVKVECDPDRQQQQQGSNDRLAATATTCFIDESLTSLDWLIELDINQLTTVPQLCQRREGCCCRGGECAGRAPWAEGPCEGCGCSEGDDPTPDWSAGADPRTAFSGLPRKPGYSYPELIFMAMQEAPGRQITVAGIYSWIKEKFPYYRTHSNKTWQNSVRHCLSLNNCFQRVNGSKEQSGKGAWRLSPEFLSGKRLKLEDMLKKSNKFMLERGGRLRTPSDLAASSSSPSSKICPPSSSSSSSYRSHRQSALPGSGSGNGGSSLIARGRQITIKLSPKVESDRKLFGSTESALSAAGSALSAASSASSSYSYSSSNAYAPDNKIDKKTGSVSSSPLSSSADDTCVFDGVVDSFDYNSGCSDGGCGDASFVGMVDYDERSDLRLLSEFLVISPEDSPMDDCAQQEQQQQAHHHHHHSHQQHQQQQQQLQQEQQHVSSPPHRRHHHRRHNNRQQQQSSEECATDGDNSDGVDVMSMMMMSADECTDLLDDAGLALTLGSAHHGQGQGHDLASASANLNSTAGCWFDMVESCDLEGFVSTCLTNL